MLGNKINKTVLSILFVILAVGFITRFDFFIAKLRDFNFVGDAKNYLIMSRQIVDDGIYGYALGHKSGHPNAYVTPGYPLILSAVYFFIHNPYLQVTAMRFIQVITGGIISPLLAFLFANRLFKRSGVSIIAALFTAIYPTYVISSTYILTEVCSIASMLLYFYLQILSIQEKKPYQAILSGLAFALNVLIRPTMLPLLVLPFLLALLTQRKSAGTALLKSFLYTVSGVILLMLPWWIRNIITMHRFILLSTGSGDPLLAGTYPYMTGLFQDYLGEKVRVSEAEYARKRIVEGFTTQTFLYLKWYTLGKLQSLFEKPWLFAKVPTASIIGVLTLKYHYLLHGLFIKLGIAGTLAGIARRDALLFTNIYAVMFLGLLLIFIPENRYAYHIMFFLMLSSSYAICFAASVLKKVWVK